MKQKLRQLALGARSACRSAIKRRSQPYVIFFTLLLAVVFLAAPDTVYAAPDVISEDSFQTFLQKWGQFLALLGSLINVVLWVVISFISDLLNNDFIFGAHMEEMLLSIWQTVRNFVNIAFVFVLLVIAFYNIVSIDTEKIPLTKSLGKVAIALILVNFSYFGAKVVLDVANVLTTAVFAIPRDIIQETDLATSDEKILAMCWKRVYLDEAGGPVESDFSSATDIITEEGTGRKYALVKLNCHIPNLVKVKLFLEEGGEDGIVDTQYDNLKVLLIHRDAAGDPANDIDLSKHEKFALRGDVPVDDVNEKLAEARLDVEDFGRDTITMVLAKTMFDINKLTEVSAAASNGFMALTISGIVNLLLLLLYGAMFVAMFIVLLFRVVYLWVCIAFSPVVALAFVFKDFGIDLGEMDIQKLFIQYAFVPVKMGVAISAGVLMLFKARQITSTGEQVTPLAENAVTIDVPISQIVNDASLQGLMWQIATVAVLWMAIKWSMKDLSGPVSSITDKVFGYVDSLGQLAARTPLVLPILPYYDDKTGERTGSTTLGQLFNTVSPIALRSKLNAAIRGDRDGGRSAEIAQKLGEIDDNALANQNSNAENQLRKLTKDENTMVDIYNNPSNRVTLAEKLKVAGLVTDGEFDRFKADGADKAAFATLIEQAMRNDGARFKNFFGVDATKDNVNQLIDTWQGRPATKEAPVLVSEETIKNDIRQNSDDWSNKEENRDTALEKLTTRVDSGEWNDDMRKEFTVQKSGGKKSVEATNQLADKLEGYFAKYTPDDKKEIDNKFKKEFKGNKTALAVWKEFKKKKDAEFKAAESGSGGSAGAGGTPPAGGGAAASGGGGTGSGP